MTDLEVLKDYLKKLGDSLSLLDSHNFVAYGLASAADVRIAASRVYGFNFPEFETPNISQDTFGYFSKAFNSNDDELTGYITIIQAADSNKIEDLRLFLSSIFLAVETSINDYELSQ